MYKLIPLKVSLQKLFTNPKLIVVSILTMLLYLVGNLLLWFSFKAGTKIDLSETIYVIAILIYSVGLILFFTFLTIYIFHKDFKQRIFNLELQSGYSMSNIYFSRIIVLIIFVGLISFWHAILGVIFYFVDKNNDNDLSYHLFINPIGWTAIFAIMVIFISLLLSFLLLPILSAMITPIFLIIILLISVFFVSIQYFVSSSENNIKYGPSNFAIATSELEYSTKLNQILTSDKSYDTLLNTIGVSFDKEYSKFLDSIMKLDTDVKALIDPLIEPINKIYHVDNFTTDDFVDTLRPLVVKALDHNANPIVTLIKQLFIDSKYLAVSFNNNDLYVFGMYINEWNRFVEAQFYNLCYYTYVKENWINLNDLNSMQSYIKRNYLANPLVQITNLMYGHNYINWLLPNLLVANSSLPVVPNIHLITSFQTVTLNAKHQVKVLTAEIKPYLRSEVIYVVYFVVMFIIINLLYFRFRRLFYKTITY